MPEGWGQWFSQGFADLAVGVPLLTTVGLLLIWVLIGLSLAGLGFAYV